jgi:CHAD domain-containing protein
MAPANHTSHPVESLRESSKWLETSMRSCLAHPRTEAVHRLRTSTRRVEAQLALLSMLPSLPPHEEQKRKALRLLKRLRQAAGQVRDIDVQRELIRAEAAAAGGAPSPDRDLRSEARRLRRQLKRTRDEEADHLLKLLNEQREQLPLVFAELENALAPVRSLALSEADLIALVRDWYASRREPDPPKAPYSTAELHEIRKRAKLARYLAESAPRSAVAARRLATQFAALQQAGGEWHDRLVLAEIATAELGRSAKLSQLFAAQARSALRAFKRRLRYKI